MRIVDKSISEEVLFQSLKLEDIFRFEGRIFMKVSSNHNELVNSYDFTKGRLTTISEDTKVRYVPSELVLHERGWELDN